MMIDWDNGSLSSRSTIVPKQRKTETENDTLFDSIIYCKDNVQSCVGDVETVNTQN